MCYYQKNSLIQTLIHRFKYHQEKEIGLFLSEQLSDYLVAFHEHQPFHEVVPIPLHPRKLRLRGYNQAAVISETVAGRLRLKHNPDLLKKISTSTSQTKKSRTDRAYSTAAPFCLNQYPEPGTHILIVDDIITTGNTLEAACNSFQGQNVKLSIATLAFTLKH